MHGVGLRLQYFFYLRGRGGGGKYGVCGCWCLKLHHVVVFGRKWVNWVLCCQLRERERERVAMLSTQKKRLFYFNNFFFFFFK